LRLNHTNFKAVDVYAFGSTYALNWKWCGLCPCGILNLTLPMWLIHINQLIQIAGMT